VFDTSGLIFENCLVTITNIWTTKIQMTKLSLDSLLTYFHSSGLLEKNIYIIPRLGHYLP